MNKPSRQQQRVIYKLTWKDIDDMQKEYYKKGLKDGKEISSNVDFRIKLSRVLNKTKGIGIKLYDAVMEKAKEVEDN